MAEHKYKQSLNQIAEMFSARLKRYGDGPECAEHTDTASQEQRMRVLCDVCDFKKMKILDFGCATGHLLAFLRENFAFEGEYVGYDISEEMVNAARLKFPDARFEVRDVLADGLSEEFDVVFISGTFNDSTGDNWGWMCGALEALFQNTRVAMAFNGLTRYVDYFDEHLFYADPMQVFDFCKSELSPLVTLRHDYSTRAGVVPYEFTTYVYRSDLAPRKKLTK